MVGVVINFFHGFLAPLRFIFFPYKVNDFYISTCWNLFLLYVSE